MTFKSSASSSPNCRTGLLLLGITLQTGVETHSSNTRRKAIAMRDDDKALTLISTILYLCWIESNPNPNPKFTLTRSASAFASASAWDVPLFGWINLSYGWGCLWLIKYVFFLFKFYPLFLIFFITFDILYSFFFLSKPCYSHMREINPFKLK